MMEFNVPVKLHHEIKTFKVEKMPSCPLDRLLYNVDQSTEEREYLNKR